MLLEVFYGVMEAWMDTRLEAFSVCMEGLCEFPNISMEGKINNTVFRHFVERCREGRGQGLKQGQA
jgi:hypothetical protein